MRIDDLGPLERSILQALTLGDAIGVPLALPSIWRLLPGYDTRLANVRSAMASGVLDPWIGVRLGHYALRDGGALLDDLGEAQGRARALWTEMKSVIRGMCKLPWIEAVAVTGRPAFGMAAPGEDAVRLVVIAEGGRVRLARWAIGAYRKARGDKGVRIQVETILDADQLGKAAGSRFDALRWLSLRPVMNDAAFQTLRAANPWIHVEFPSAVQDTAGGLPDYQVDAGRFDGRLARVRRSMVGGAGDSPEVMPLFVSGARIEGGIAAVEERFQASLEGDGAECPTREGSAALEAAFDARWAEVSAWEVPGEPVRPLTPTDVEIEPVETPKRAKKAKVEAEASAAPDPTPTPEPEGQAPGESPAAEAAPSTQADDPKPPRGKARGARKRPTRRASSASSETGRRARGRRRK